MIEIESKIWAVTTYYNPCNYKRRLENFKVFRENLNLPLLVVELSYGIQYDLTKNDAEIVLQLKGSSIMWQKERLLNIAIDNLPKHVENVVWLDCDIIIDSNDWIEKTATTLKTKKMVQLFSKLFDLNKDEVLTEIEVEKRKPSGYSISYLLQSDMLIKNDFQPASTSGMRRAAFGLAWAASRKLLDKYKFYDYMILGSGDRSMACAGLGRFEDFMTTACLSPTRINHYLKWATPFHAEVNGSIGFLDCNLLHLWHGDLVNRKYLERHQDFNAFDFNPSKDIIMDDNGSWKWNTKNTSMIKYVSNYFSSRLEDGIV